MDLVGRIRSARTKLVVPVLPGEQSTNPTECDRAEGLWDVARVVISLNQLTGSTVVLIRKARFPLSSFVHVSFQPLFLDKTLLAANGSTADIVN